MELEKRVRQLTREHVEVVPYDSTWPEQFCREEAHLRACLPSDLVGRIEHFGSTAVPGLAAKPIIDILVEVGDLEAAKTRIVPILESQQYDYFWRPTRGDGGPPFYAWFIKRDPATGARTHHIHMVEPGFLEHWDRLLFRDYLVQRPDLAKEYETLKLRLAASYPNDRIAYTRGKTEFIVHIMNSIAIASVRQVALSWTEAMELGDLQTLARLMTPDIVVVHGNGRMLTGQDAVLADIQRSLDGWRVRQQITFEETFVVDCWAFDRARVATMLAPVCGGEAQTEFRSRTFTLLRRDASGAWKMARTIGVIEQRG